MIFFTVKSEDNESKPEVSAFDKSDINNRDGGLETCINNNVDIMTEGNNNCVEETDTDVCANTLGEVTAPDTESIHTADPVTDRKVGVRRRGIWTQEQ